MRGNKKTIFYLRTDLDVRNLKAGGSVAHTVGVIKGFFDNGHEIICASSAMINILKNIKFKAFRELATPKIFARAGFRMNCFISNFFFVIQTFFFVRKNNIDAVYQRYSLLNFVGLIISRIKRVPFILEFNGSEVWIDKNWQGKGFVRIRFLIRWVENLNIKRADYIVVVSQALKDMLVEQGTLEEKILVNPNGVDTNQFDPARLESARERVRKELGLQNKFVFGFIGSFSIWHGIETIAAMIPEVVKKSPHTHFLLIGSGPLFLFLQRELTKNKIGSEFVTLLGTVTQSNAKNYLSACDAFLSPTNVNSDGSRFFGSPTKMFEYMSLGKPIIASDLEQLSELLFPAVHSTSEEIKETYKDKVGFLVRPGDVQGFVDVACHIASMDKHVCTEIGNNARNKAIQQYSWKDHTKKIIIKVWKT